MKEEEAKKLGERIKREDPSTRFEGLICNFPDEWGAVCVDPVSEIRETFNSEEEWEERQERKRQATLPEQPEAAAGARKGAMTREEADKLAERIKRDEPGKLVEGLICTVPGEFVVACFDPGEQLHERFASEEEWEKREERKKRR